MRLLHIVAGVFWVGSAAFVALFLLPTARASGAEGGRLVARLMQRMGPIFGVAMLLTVIPGFIMYRAWVGTPTGLALGAGAAATILAVVVGIGVSNPPRAKSAALKKSLEAQGVTPTADQTAQLAGWQSRAELGAQASAMLLLIAAGAMAVARYL